MILSILRSAVAHVRANLRLVGTAWLLNTALALLVAIPFLNELDRAISPTVQEEELLRQFDTNWYQTWQFNNASSPFLRAFDYSSFGAAPFIHHLDGMLSGGTVQAVGQTFLTLVRHFRVDTSQLSLLTLLALLYACGSAFLSGGFISAYALGLRVTVAEFIADGARFFGRMFRIALIGFVPVFLLVAVLGPWLSDTIAQRTAHGASEWTPYILHLLKNGFLLLLLWCVGLVLDYARVRTVIEDRTSMLIAAGKGGQFVVTHPGVVIAFSLVAAGGTAGLMLLFALGAAHISATGYWSIALLFLVQQMFLALRMVVKAFSYAGEVAIVREGGERS
jgi:hypothetical protein